MVRFGGREYIADITSGAVASTFKLQQFFVNPGLEATFPWGSTIANNFLKYRILKCKFVFISTSSNALNSVNTQLGIIAMRYQGDPVVAIDNSLHQMQNSAGCKIAGPDRNQSVDVAAGGSAVDLHIVRHGPRPAGTDSRMYDYGYIEIASTGMQGTNVNLGQLWVEYSMEYIEPLYIQGRVGSTVSSCHIINAIAGNCDRANPLGTLSTVVSNNGLDMTIGVSGGGFQNLIFPPDMAYGRYFIMFTWIGGDATVVAPTSAAVNVAFVQSVRATTIASTDSSPADGATSGRLMQWCVIDINGPAASFRVGTGGTLPATVGVFDCLVLQYNNLML